MSVSPLVFARASNPCSNRPKWTETPTLWNSSDVDIRENQIVTTKKLVVVGVGSHTKLRLEKTRAPLPSSHRPLLERYWAVFNRFSRKSQESNVQKRGYILHDFNFHARPLATVPLPQESPSLETSGTLFRLSPLGPREGVFHRRFSGLFW